MTPQGRPDKSLSPTKQTDWFGLSRETVQKKEQFLKLKEFGNGSPSLFQSLTFIRIIDKELRNSCSNDDYILHVTLILYVFSIHFNEN